MIGHVYPYFRHVGQWSLTSPVSALRPSASTTPLSPSARVVNPSAPSNVIVSLVGWSLGFPMYLLLLLLLCKVFKVGQVGPLHSSRVFHGMEDILLYLHLMQAHHLLMLVFHLGTQLPSQVTSFIPIVSFRLLVFGALIFHYLVGGYLLLLFKLQFWLEQVKSHIMHHKLVIHWILGGILFIVVQLHHNRWLGETSPFYLRTRGQVFLHPNFFIIKPRLGQSFPSWQH